MKKICLTALIIILFFPIQGHSQDSCTRIIGISATIQTSQLGIMVPVWLGKEVSIAPLFSFQWGEKQGIDYTLGLFPKFYFNTKKLSPYLGIRGAFATFIPDKENETEQRTTDWIVGLAVGAEYFFDPMFSLGVELQGNFTKSDKNSMRFNNPGNLNFNLGTMVSANVYFLR